MLVPLLALALVGLWFRQRGAIFRFVALLALAAALFNPVFLNEEREPLKSVVALIVDRSQSQDIGDRTKQTDGKTYDAVVPMMYDIALGEVQG